MTMSQEKKTAAKTAAKTKNTTAKITSQHGLIYSNIAKKYGTDAAGLYLEANEAALWEYKKLARCQIDRNMGYFRTVSLIMLYTGKRNLGWYTALKLWGKNS